MIYNSLENNKFIVPLKDKKFENIKNAFLTIEWVNNY